MTKKIKGADGKVYQQVVPSSNRKRTLEIIVGAVALFLSATFIISSLGLAGIADNLGGQGYYTIKMTFGLAVAIVAFILTLFINKKRVLIGWLVLICGLYLLLFCGDFGIIGGIIYVIDGIIILARK